MKRATKSFLYLILAYVVISSFFGDYTSAYKNKEEFIMWLNDNLEGKIAFQIENAYDSDGVLVCWVKDWKKIGYQEKQSIVFSITMDWVGYKDTKGVVFKDYYSGEMIAKEYWGDEVKNEHKTEQIEFAHEGPHTIYLKNGNIIKGLIVEEDEKDISIMMYAGTVEMSFSKEEILK